MDINLKPHKVGKVNWPPDEWWDGSSDYDERTQLPTSLYPYYITQSRDDSTWTLHCVSKDVRGTPIETGFEDIFDAVERMLFYYRNWFPSRPFERVYFIGASLTKGASVKIGRSIYPERRLKTLQTGYPEELRILATIEGGRALEESYHRRWRMRRAVGEWFTLGDCIIKEIERINAMEATS